MPVGLVVGLRAEARIARRLAARLGARIEIGGGDTAGAARAARRLVDAGAGALISFGLAGGLAPGLRAGCLLIPARILVDGRLVACDPALVARLGGPTEGVLLAGETLAATAEDKRRLHAATGAAAVDLETAAVVRAAEQAGMAFAAMRAVCDAASRSLPPAALLALGQGGEIGLARVAASVLRRPAQLPALIALGRDAARARAALLRQSVGR